MFSLTYYFSPALGDKGIFYYYLLFHTPTYNKHITKQDMYNSYIRAKLSSTLWSGKNTKTMYSRINMKNIKTNIREIRVFLEILDGGLATQSRNPEFISGQNVLIKFIRFFKGLGTL